MRRLITLGSAVLLASLASEALADPIEFSFAVTPPQVDIAGGGRTYRGFRLVPKGQLEVTARGGGVFKLFYFQEYTPGTPFPTDVRLLVSIDGTGKMFPISARPLPGLQFTGTKGRALPSAPTPLNLQLAPGEHKIVLRLATGGDSPGYVAFPEARQKSAPGADFDLDLDVPAKPAVVAGLDLGDDDLDLPPVIAPAPRPTVAANDDLDLDFMPTAPSKPAPRQNFDLDLDIPAKPVVVAANTKPLPTLVAKPAPPTPVKPAPPTPVVTKPKKPPPKPKALAMVVEPVVLPPEEPSGPPPRLGQFEIGPKGGYAISRGRLKGQGFYLVEFAYRLPSFEKVRLVAASGYTLLTGAWSGIEPGRGLGWFHQNTQLVPLEIGATFEPVSFGIVTPYVGLAVSAGIASTSLQRFSLPDQLARGAALGFTGAAGVRLQFGKALMVFELRHNESAVAKASVARLGQQTLSATALTGGALFSF